MPRVQLDILLSETSVSTALSRSIPDAPREMEARVEQWVQRHEDLYRRWCGLLGEVRSGSQVSFPLFAVAIRELVETFADKWPDRRGQLSGQLTVIRQDLVEGM